MDLPEFMQAALDSPEVTKIIQSSAKHRDEIFRAAQVLVADEDTNSTNARAALQKVAAGLVDGIEIFISHKKEDVELAKCFKSVLGRVLLGRAEIKMAPESVGPGRDWWDRISGQIKSSHWIIILMPDAAMDRGWLLLEAGIFIGSALPGDRLIWLYHAEKPNSEHLNRFQGVKLVEEEISAFLRDLATEPDAIPGMGVIDKNRVLRDSDYSAFASEIIQFVPAESNLREISYIDFVDIEIAAVDHVTPYVLRSAKVLYCSAPRSIFGREDTVSRFGDLIEMVSLPASGGESWVVELADAMNDVIHSRTPEPIHSIFSGAHPGTSHHPMLYAVRSRPNGDIVSFRIILPTTLRSTGGRQPLDLKVLMVALRLAYRFRWEVIEVYDRADLTERDVEAVERIVRRMEDEAKYHGVVSQHIERSFDDPILSRTIATLNERYQKLRDPVNRQGALDIAFQKKDPQSVIAAIEELRDINTEFLYLASDRLPALIRKYG